MSEQILWFPHDWPFIPARKNWFKDNGYVPVPYSPSLLSEAKVVLLVTPVRDQEGTWISPEPVWRNYLADTYPTIKVIQAGWHDSAPRENYLHWYDLPPNFEAFLQNSKTVAEGWQPFDTMGADLRDIWAKFRDGHDKNGFMDWFIVVKRRCALAHQTIVEDSDEYQDMMEYLNEPDTLEAFRNTIQRWNRYAAIFAAAPFLDHIAALSACTKQLGLGWEDCTHAELLKNRLAYFMETNDKIDLLLAEMSKWCIQGLNTNIHP
ncbi:MAG: hypothetical protein RIR11_5021 [Bacteroidota bacterium]|jgi:hypothetical protein